MQQLLARKVSSCCPLQQPIAHRLQSHHHRHASKQQQQQQQISRTTTCAAALLPELQTLLGQAGAAHPGWAAGAAVNAAVFAAGSPVLLKGLTGWGMVNAFILGTTVFAAFGAGGFGLVCVYFLFGTAVTKVKLEEKQKEGIAEARSGRRGPIGFVACFTSKLSDTVSSEIGKAYGKTTYLITSLQLVPRGTEGAVSLEGTLAGLGAAAVYAATALALGQASPSDVVIITAAAFIANVFESYLGAALQGRVDWLNNDIVNVLQISVAAALAVTGKYYL